MKKRKQEKKTYPVLVYKPHPSGIGGKCIKTEYVETKPTYDTHYWDVTNGMWARDEK